MIEPTDDPVASTTPGQRPGSFASATIPAELWPEAERGGFRLRVGLRPLDPHRWVLPGEDLASALEAKRELLDTRYGEVVAGEVGSEVAGEELLEVLVEHLVSDQPEIYQRRGDQLRMRLAAERLVALEVAGRHPVDTAGRLVHDDWCLLDDGGPEVRLVGASLCFPGRWRLLDKLGHGMPAVHGPVPRYAEQLAPTVDATLRRLVPERPMWRSNWTLIDDPAMFQQSAGPVPHLSTPEQAGHTIWLRVERQTLRRLPRTGGIVFGIRTFQEPLTGLVGRPARAAQLLAAVEQLPPETVEYKSVTEARPLIEAWLARCAT